MICRPGGVRRARRRCFRRLLRSSPVRACLIVDDEEAFRYVMRRMIDAQQYEILEAADGDAAVTAAQSVHPDIIILDINLPQAGWLHVCLSELARDGDTRDIPVIMSTSSGAQRS